MIGKVVAVCKSVHKGERKVNVGQAQLIENFGMDGDAHSGPWDTHIRLLAQESIYKAFKRGLNVGPGDFSENITTRGIDLSSLRVGTKLKVGNAVIEITKKGKECKDKCNIFNLIGDCIISREGVYAKVLRGGLVFVGDEIHPFLDINVGIIYVKNNKPIEEKLLENVIRKSLSMYTVQVTDYNKVDNKHEILKSAIIEMCEKNLDIVFVVGGAGIFLKDNSPEVILEVVEKELPGIAENIRGSFQEPEKAMVYRGRSGIRGSTLIVNLPDNVEILNNCLLRVLPVLAKLSSELSRVHEIQCIN